MSECLGVWILSVSALRSECRGHLDERQRGLKILLIAFLAFLLSICLCCMAKVKELLSDYRKRLLSTRMIALFSPGVIPTMSLEAFWQSLLRTFVVALRLLC
jgi:hypothetical protein